MSQSQTTDKNLFKVDDITSAILILGTDIETPIGNIHPIRLKNYDGFLQTRNSLMKEDFEYKEDILTITGDNEVMQEFLKSGHIFDLCREYKVISDTQQTFFFILYEQFRIMIKYHFEEDVIDKIKNGEEFEAYREAIRKINGIKYTPKNPNPEIQRANDVYEKMQSMKGNGTSFESMVTSVALMYSVNIKEITLYQLNKYFERAQRYEEFKTQTMLAPFSSEKMEWKQWFTDIEVEKKEELTVTQEEIENATTKML